MEIGNLIKEKTKEIPDWPKKGVNFKDITPLLQDKEIFRKIIDALAQPYLFRWLADKKIDKIVGIDARGFLLAAPLAYKLKTGIAIVRKKGKLKGKILGIEFLIELGFLKGRNKLRGHKIRALAKY